MTGDDSGSALDSRALPPAFSRVLLTAELLRARTLALFFGLLLALVVVRGLIELTCGMDAATLAAGLWPPVVVLGGLAATEALAWRLAWRHRGSGTAVPGVLWFLLTLIEVGGLTAGMILLESGQTSRPDLSGEVTLLLLFLSLSALRLSFGASAFTGACIAAGFLVMVAARTASGGVPGEDYLWTMLVIVGSGVAVGLMAQAVRKQALRLVRVVEEREQLQRDVLSATEREQARIGRDLHDSVGAHLTGVSFYTRGLLRGVEQDQAPTADELRMLAELVEGGVAQVRSISRGLTPSELGETGLAAALEELAASSEAVSGVRCTFDLSGTPTALDASTREHLYRIAQESLTNALKHAAPTLVALDLAYESDGLVLTVRDDGPGCQEGATAGSGMRTMRQRAQLIGAQVEVTQDSGCVVRCTLQRRER